MLFKDYLRSLILIFLFNYQYASNNLKWDEKILHINVSVENIII